MTIGCRPIASRIIYFLCIIALPLLTSCGGGGGGGGSSSGSSDSTPTSTSSSFLVSGTVSTPGGTLASSNLGKGIITSLLDSIIPAAHAGITGISSAPDGTLVELVTIDDSGNIISTLATTHISNGSYSFNLTEVGVEPSSNLVVRVTNPISGMQIRSFVFGDTVNINPISEAAMQVILTTISSSSSVTLNNFSTQEIKNLVNSIDLYTSINNTQAGANLASSVTLIKTAITNENSISSYLNQISQQGSNEGGPGDLGDFFPTTQGASWSYDITETETGAAAVTYSDTVSVNGTTSINGSTTTIYRHSNPENSGIPSNYYYEETDNGIYDWTDYNDGTLPGRYITLPFPATPGLSQPQLDTSLLYDDLDEDGHKEITTFKSDIKILSFENVTVPFGSIPEALKIETSATLKITLSSTGNPVTAYSTETRWFAKQLGLIKEETVLNLAYASQTATYRTSKVLASASGLPVTRFTAATTWTELPQVVNDVIYDSKNNRLFASIASSDTVHANTIARINPDTTEVEAYLPSGTNPGSLAISEDGEYLYVGLRGTPNIQQIRIPTFTIEKTIPISYYQWDSATYIPRYAYDIEVQPGTNNTIAASTVNTFGPGISATGIVAFNNQNELNNNTTNKTLSIEFTSPGTLYGKNYSNTHYIYRYTVNPSGITESAQYRLANSSNPNWFRGNIDEQNGYLYGNQGVKFDPDSLSIIGTYDPYQAITFDKTNNNLLTALKGNGIHFKKYNQNNLSLLDSFTLPATLSYNEYPERLTHIKTNLMSLVTTEHKLMIIQRTTN